MAKDDLPIDKINKLSEILKEQNLTEIEIEAEGFKIKVRKESTPVVASGFAHANPAVSTHSAGNAVNSSSSAVSSGENFFEIKSPMVGTFYASPSPDAASFVKVGDKVKKGDVLCIVEAMKLMNELPSEVDGEIVDILVANSEAISFGQILMKIRKN